MSKLQFSKYLQLRWFSEVKVFAKLDEQFSTLLDEKQAKHRQHPGIVRPTVVQTPPWIIKSITNVIEDSGLSKSEMYMQAKQLVNFLRQRRLPESEDSVSLKKLDVADHIHLPTEEITENVFETNTQAKRLLKELVYNWKTVDYNKRHSLLYMIGRSVPEYAVLYRILIEIQSLDTQFNPNSLFDFGSGIGTVMWASSQIWPESFKEFFCIDISADMNDLSGQLIKHAKPAIKTIFYRQFFPALPDPPYDIVVCAYSLHELPNRTARLDTLLKLWQRARRYLIIVEFGNVYGFELVNEARDFVLSLGKKRNSLVGHVFSPCPHDVKCPSYKQRKICNFIMNYYSLNLCGPSSLSHELFSYVVIKKGRRSERDDQWPRIVHPVLKRSQHVICRMCTPNGQTKNEVFTRYRNGRNAYRCARSSKWGDRLPVSFVEMDTSKQSCDEAAQGRIEDEHKESEVD